MTKKSSGSGSSDVVGQAQRDSDQAIKDNAALAEIARKEALAAAVEKAKNDRNETKGKMIKNGAEGAKGMW